MANRKPWTGLNCMAEGCDRVAVSNAACDTHYRRMKNYGNFDAPGMGQPRKGRLCTGCGETDEAKFYPRNASQCKKCHGVATKLWMDNNPDRKVKYYSKALTAERTYSLPPGGYDEMLAAQDGMCASCGSDGGERGLSVDHDHSMCCPGAKSCRSCVRGLLCGPCNRALGMVRDSVDTLLNLVAYLERHAAPVLIDRINVVLQSDIDAMAAA